MRLKSENKMEQYYYEPQSASAIPVLDAEPYQVQQPQQIVYQRQPQQQGIRITYCVNHSLDEFEYQLHNMKDLFSMGQSRHNLKPIHMSIFGKDINEDFVSYSRIFSKYEYDITEAYMDVTKTNNNHLWGLIKSSKVSACFVEIGRFTKKVLWNNKKVGDIYQKDHRKFKILDIKTEVKNVLGFSYNTNIISGTYIKTRFLKAQPKPETSHHGGGGGGGGCGGGDGGC